MKNVFFVLFSASSVNYEELRKEARKMAKMFLNAETEEDPSSQEAKFLEAESFSSQIEEKYGGYDEATIEKIREIIDEETNKVSMEYFRQETMDGDNEEDL